MLRQRRKAALVVVKELDAFPKVPESYVLTTASGGTISIISFLLMALFVVSEFRYYTASRLKFRYDVDREVESTLQINIDITVAMPCHAIGADILDVTNQNAEKFGQLNEEATWFDLSPKQQSHFDSMRYINTYLRQEFHGIQDLIWATGYTAMFGNMPARETEPKRNPDSCRLHGTLMVNKVAGNFHITAGKSIPYPRGHAHLSAFMSPESYNFSHRIERLSFGDTAPGIINPLDAEEKITVKSSQLYQYYLQIVPTDVNIKKYKGGTYQFSITEQERDINHAQGSHGIPGIYFKYDMSPIKVMVTEEREPYWRFLVRICAIVGGIFATSGIVNSVIDYVLSLLFCRSLSTRQEHNNKS